MRARRLGHVDRDGRRVIGGVQPFQTDRNTLALRIGHCAFDLVVGGEPRFDTGAGPFDHEPQTAERASQRGVRIEKTQMQPRGRIDHHAGVWLKAATVKLHCACPYSCLTYRA